MYINLNNQTIYYQKIGRGKNLVLLHGWRQNSSSFWPIVDHLKNHFTLWLLDLPGFGRSDLPPQTWGVSNYTKTILQFIKQQKIQKPIILGHSLGGRITIKLAAQYPQFINKIILEDAAGLKPKQTPIKFFSYLAAKIIKIFIPDLLGIKTKLRYRLYKSLESDYLQAGEMKQVFLNLIQEDLTSDLKKIQVPTLLIWGEDDPIVPLSLGKQMYQLIPNSTMEVLEEVGHFPHLEKPDLFCHYVKDFA